MTWPERPADSTPLNAAGGNKPGLIPPDHHLAQPGAAGLMPAGPESEMKGTMT
jgi:hypothetical protein